VQSRAGHGLWADGPQIEDDYRRYFATL
jgi:hypothetical protein